MYYTIGNIYQPALVLGEESIMDWMFVCPQNLYVEGPTLNVMVHGDGASGRWWGLDEVMSVSPLWWDWCPQNKRKTERVLFPTGMHQGKALRGQSKKAATYKPELGPLQELNLPGLWSWTSQSPELREINVYCLRYRGCDLLLWWRKLRKTVCVWKSMGYN